MAGIASWIEWFMLRRTLNRRIGRSGLAYFAIAHLLDLSEARTLIRYL
jgi:hypothetical protein